MSDWVKIGKREVLQSDSSVHQCLMKPGSDGLKFDNLSDQTSLVRSESKLKFILWDFDFPTGNIIWSFVRKSYFLYDSRKSHQANWTLFVERADGKLAVALLTICTLVVLAIHSASLGSYRIIWLKKTDIQTQKTATSPVLERVDTIQLGIALL